MEFTEKFMTYSNTELLRIIECPENYQLEAIETAKTILEKRHLTEEELKKSKDEIELERTGKSNIEIHKIAVKDNSKSIIKSILSKVYPVQNEIPAAEKIIRIISLLFGGIFVFQLYNKLSMIGYMFSDSSEGWDFGIVLYFLPIVVLPAAIYLFYRRKKLGWILMTIYLTYSALSVIQLLILSIKMNNSGFEAMDKLYPQPSTTVQLISILFLVGTIWVISSNRIRIVYAISTLTLILTILITTAIVGIGLKSG